MITCEHVWKKSWDGKYRTCTLCELSNLYLGIPNEEVDGSAEDCTQETFYEPDEWNHDGEKYLVSLNNGLFIPHVEGSAGSGTAVTYTFKYSVSTTINFDSPKETVYPIMKVSPHSTLGKSLVSKAHHG